jgi:hypothetical protein
VSGGAAFHQGRPSASCHFEPGPRSWPGQSTSASTQKRMTAGRTPTHGDVFGPLHSLNERLHRGWKRELIVGYGDEAELEI